MDVQGLEEAVHGLRRHGPRREPDSATSLGLWLWSAAASKKGISSLQVKRVTGLTYKSALFMMHRIRFAMAED